MQMSQAEEQSLREAVRSELSLSSKCCLEQIVSTCQPQSAPQDQLRRTVQRARQGGGDILTPRSRTQTIPRILQSVLEVRNLSREIIKACFSVH